MKLARLFATLATVSVGVLAESKSCSEGVIASITALHKYERCSRDSGFALLTNDSIALTAELLGQICATDDCLALLASVRAMGVQECEVAGLRFFMDIVAPIEKACDTSTSDLAAADIETQETDTATGAAPAPSTTKAVTLAASALRLNQLSAFER